MNNIEIGSIVKFINPDNESKGWFRVTKSTSKTVNLGAIFGGRIYFKGVDRNAIVEDEAAWYSAWQKTESYQCM